LPHLKKLIVPILGAVIYAILALGLKIFPLAEPLQIRFQQSGLKFGTGLVAFLHGFLSAGHGRKSQDKCHEQSETFCHDVEPLLGALILPAVACVNN
jgi:hypothetical protein